MHNFLIKETPGKIMGLLGVCLFSLALLFGVSAGNVSFRGPETVLPSPFDPARVLSFLASDPFGPEHVASKLDVVASVYSNFIHQNITGPARQSFAYFGYSWREDSAWVIGNTDQQILAMTGLSDLVWQEPTPLAHPAPHSGRVAGAFTMRFAP